MNTADKISNNKLNYFLLILVILLCGVFFYVYSKDQLHAIEVEENLPLTLNNQAPFDHIVIYAVGDIMVHKEQLVSGYNKKTKSYDFSHFFNVIKNIFIDGDMVIGNLETPIAGEYYKYSGYPTFNAPASLVKNIKNIGFTHLVVSNNHALDRGWQGLFNTIHNVTSNGITPVGAKQYKEEKNYSVFVKNNIHVGILAYTYGTNGFSLTKDKVFMLNKINKENIKLDLENVKKENPDIVIVNMHFGDEYKTDPNSYQKDIAQYTCDMGADIIIGNHPHVLEPIEWIISKDGHKCFVMYSLGNFVSSMNVLYTDLGGIIRLEVIKGTDNKEISIIPDFIPTVVDYGSGLDNNSFVIKKLDDFILDKKPLKTKYFLYEELLNKKIILFKENEQVTLFKYI